MRGGSSTHRLNSRSGAEDVRLDGRKELEALDQTVKHAQSAATSVSKITQSKSGGAGSVSGPFSSRFNDLRDEATSRAPAPSQPSFRTVPNMSMPAYPPTFTPPTRKPAYMMSDVASGLDVGAIMTPDGIGGGDAALPIQEGPLAYYPDFSSVDLRRKWQTIQDWAAGDSVSAMGDDNGIGSSHLMSPSVAVTELDDSRSIDSSLLEIEMDRSGPPAAHQQQSGAAVTPQSGWTGVSGYASNGGSAARATMGGLAAEQIVTPQVPSFAAERAALEARCRLAEEQVLATEVKQKGEAQRLTGCISGLEADLSTQQLLVGQLQDNLSQELLRVREASEAAAQARTAESSMREMLDMTKKTLEEERRRSANSVQHEQALAKLERARSAALEDDKAALQLKLQDKTNVSTRLQAQLQAASQVEAELRNSLQRSEAHREEQERRLEMASALVSDMRAELQTMNARLAARDHQLLKHVEEVEQQQIRVMRDDLESCRNALTLKDTNYAALRDTCISIYQALSPQALATTFSYSDSHTSAFSATAEMHREQTERLLSSRVLSKEDGDAVGCRVRELLREAQSMCLMGEKQEVAMRNDVDQMVTGLKVQVQQLQRQLQEESQMVTRLKVQVQQLQRQLQEESQSHESKLAASSLALKAATSRVEELMDEIVQQRDLMAQQVAADEHEAERELLERQLGQELMDEISQQRELMAQQAAADEHEAERELLERQLGQALAHGAEVEEEARRLHMQLQTELQHASERAAKLNLAESELAQITETSQAKEDRIHELRSALSSAMEGQSSSEEYLKAQVEAEVERVEVALRHKAQAQGKAENERVVVDPRHKAQAQVEAEVERVEVALRHKAQAMERCGELEHCLKQECERVADLSSHCTQLEQSNATAEAHLSTAKAQLEALTQQVVAAAQATSVLLSAGVGPVTESRRTEADIQQAQSQAELSLAELNQALAKVVKLPVLLTSNELDPCMAAARLASEAFTRHWYQTQAELTRCTRGCGRLSHEITVLQSLLHQAFVTICPKAPPDLAPAGTVEEPGDSSLSVWLDSAVIRVFNMGGQVQEVREAAAALHDDRDAMRRQVESASSEVMRMREAADTEWGSLRDGVAKALQVSVLWLKLKLGLVPRLHLKGG
eukprot:gene29415-5765_t